MANASLPTPINNNNNEDEAGHVSVDIPTSETRECRERYRQPILHKVPPQLREDKKYIYNPMVLSLGPYHHNLQQFHQVEEFKNEILINMLDPSTKDLFYNKILQHVDEIRIFYGGLSVDEYKDEALVEMMLRDACFLLYYMKVLTGDREKEAHLYGCLGLSTMVFLFRDYYLLENQIPLWILELLLTLKFGDGDAGEAFICEFLSVMGFHDRQRMTRLPWAGKEQGPLHLLEAHRLVSIAEDDLSSTIEHCGRIFELIKWRRKGSSPRGTYFEANNSPFRSVTYLKSKGIYFGPSSHCLKDIRFNSYAFYGKLQLPIWFVTNNTKVLFSNIIAFEMSPKAFTHIDVAVLSYVNFMKSLLENPKDVKELREKGILFSNLRNDEEVLKVFKEIDTHGMDKRGIFREVNMRINKHCNSKAKTWMAELFHTNFHSPWTAIAPFVASFLLCLTFLQTYYTVNPRNTN